MVRCWQAKPSLAKPKLYPLVEVDVVCGVLPLRLHHDLGKLVAPVHLHRLGMQR